MIDEEIKRLKKLVLASKVFDARKKWAIIRYLNQNKNSLSDERINHFFEIFENEWKYIKLWEQKAKEEYLEKLDKRHEDLDKMNENLKQELKNKEKSDREEEEKKEEDLLNQLDNI